MIIAATEEVPTMEPMTEQWTESQIMRLPDVPGKYELVEGELVVVAAGYEHEMVLIRLTRALLNAVDDSVGQILSSNMGYWMRNGNFRSPDISFVAKDHLADMIRDRKGFLHGAPDLAIEVLSPSNSVKAMKKKALEYFESGSRLVWFVVADDQTVVVLYPDGSETTVTDTLTGEVVLPGFSVEVGELFQDLETQ